MSDNEGGDAPPPRQRRRGADNGVHMLDNGWHSKKEYWR